MKANLKKLSLDFFDVRMFVAIVIVITVLAISYLAGFAGNYLFSRVLGKIGIFPQLFYFWTGRALGVFLFCYVAYRLLYRFFDDAIREIPADPPHRAILLVLQKRTNRILGEGWRFFPFYDTLFGAILINVAKHNEDLSGQIVRTPDKARLSIKISITWSAGSWKAWETKPEREAELLNNFINSGGEEGVKKIYKDIIEDRLRTWAFSAEEGPVSWEEAMRAKDDAIAILIKAILGDDIPSIPSEIPTNVLLRYFNSPRKSPLEYQKKLWGRKTENGSEWEQLEEHLGRLSADALESLKKTIRGRQKTIATLKRGNGLFIHKKLGITINLITIDDVALVGDLAEAADLQVKEQAERAAEIIELEHFTNRLKALRKEQPEISLAQAVEVVQTERGKIVKTVGETKFSGSTEFLNSLKEIAGFFKR